MRVRSLSRDDLLKEEMPTHSSILAWKSPWTEEPSGLQSTVHGATESQNITEQLSTHTRTEWGRKIYSQGQSTPRPQ